MAKIDRLKEDIQVLKEEFRNLFLLLLATLTGTFTSIYQVLIGKVEAYILLVSISGLIVSGFVTLLLKKVRLKIDKNLDELEKL